MYFLTFSCWYQGVDMFGERIGFLKFKADIFDKETGKKVCSHLHALF
jgi:ADP-sugar diphosphatase